MSKITEEIQLPHMQLKNRLVRSAVHSFLGNTDGTMSAAEYQMYEKLAQNEIGMIVTGHVSVSPLGMANDNQTAVYDDRLILQFARLKELVAPYGAKIIVQLNHAGPRAVNNEDLAGVVARDLKKGRRCRALTVEEIDEIRTRFIEAAARLKSAGADGVQIHAAHSYLLSQFLDATFNRRDDAYGGGIENRFRLLGEIAAGIKAACGAAFPVLVKVNSDTATDNEAYEEDLIEIVRRLAAIGIEAVELSGYDFLSKSRAEHNYYLERAARVKQAVAEMPLILVGGARSLGDMEEILARGIDMVSLGRPLISEPDLLPRLLAGQEKSRCVSCNRCFAIAHLQPGVRCVFDRKKKAKALQ